MKTHRELLDYKNEWKRKKRESETSEERERRRSRDRVVFRAWYARTKEKRREIMLKQRSKPDQRGKAVKRTQEWAKKNPERVKFNGRYGKLRRKYGLSPEEYARMLAKQNGVCAICGGAKLYKRHGQLPVDHDHASNKVRGLLCSMCNDGIGRFREEIGLLEKAIAYLLKHGCGWRSIAVDA